ncbi:GGDEF domain-containing protein [Desulfovibrio sp. OttesenSCG-928-A18]|nr:GGDEF domain-containing protein [Desulfovibrio sp. OttesenSCG-928-A18]
MPTKQPENSLSCSGELKTALVRDLAVIAAILREKAGAEALSEEAFALVRVIKGLSAGEWTEIAVQHGLENWLGIELGTEMSGTLESLLSTQECLIFQRDHDVLTGLGNRRLFEARLASELERSLRSDSELSLLYIDLDDFKKINDSYGHACGDNVLRRLGEILRGSVRHYDIPCRIGGEEFAVILPSTACWTGVMLANRLLELFRKEVFSCDDALFSMTFSCGVSGLAVLEHGDKTPEQLVQSADKALYQAKSQGKNTVLLAESERFARDKGSLVRAEEKQLLFSLGDTE